MFKKVMGLIAGFLVLMFFVTLFQVKAGTKTTAKELEDKVIVYTTYDKEITDIIKTEFEKSTSINVEITKFSSDADMVKTLKNKKDVVPDVILGASTDTYEELKKENLLGANKPSWYYDVKDGEKDKDGYWYSLFGSPIVMFYNTSAISADQAPQNLIALSDKKYANLIVMPNIDSTDFKYFLNTVISPYVKDNKVDDGFKAISAMKFNIKEFKEPGKQVVDAVSKKEGAVGFAELSKVNDAIKKGSTLAVAYGTDKYPITADGIAIIKDSANINAAKLFEEFAAGPKMQYKIAKKFKLNPTNTKALELCGGEVGELKDKTYGVDMTVFKANIDSWIEKWKAIVKEEKPAANTNAAGGTVTNNAATQVNGYYKKSNNTTVNNGAQTTNANANKQAAGNAAVTQQNKAGTSASSTNNAKTTAPANADQNNSKSQNNTGTTTGKTSTSGSSKGGITTPAAGKKQ